MIGALALVTLGGAARSELAINPDQVKEIASWLSSKQITTQGLPFRVNAKELNEDVTTSKKPTRLGIALVAPTRAATVTMRITPVKR